MIKTVTSPPASGLRQSLFTLYTAAGLAIDSIFAHKLRSFLTLLGVVIGVSSVILVGAAIGGLGSYAEKSTAKAFGTDSYLVAQIAVVGNLTRKEFTDMLKRNKRIQQTDVDFLRSVNGDRALYSTYKQRSEDVKAEGQTYETAAIIGTSATLPDIRDVAVVDGRYFTDGEEQSRVPVCVIGDEIRTTLFPSGSPLGRKLRLRGIDFAVVGVQEKLGSSFGRSQDNSVYIPITMFYRLFGGQQNVNVFGRARIETGETLEQSLDETRAALRGRFHTKPGETDNFGTLTPDSIRAFTDRILGLISVVVVPVTCISLLVGGIVIMNIMLVSVTERTREIGVRKSLGAKKSDVLLQFLLEAVMVAAVGGLLGVALGAGFTAIASQVFGASMRITWPYVLIALFVSSATGVISGWYPASRAANLDPIVALRAE